MLVSLGHLILDRHFHLALMLCSSRPDPRVGSVIDLALLLTQKLLLDLHNVVVVAVHLYKLLVDQGVDPRPMFVGLLHLDLG